MSQISLIFFSLSLAFTVNSLEVGLTTSLPSTSLKPVVVTSSTKPPLGANSTVVKLEEPKLGEAKEGKEDDILQANAFPFFHQHKAIGDSCKTTDDCTIKEAFCVNGTCQCSSEFVASGNKRRCFLKARKLLDDCIENVQCEAGMNATGLVSCISYKCICALDAHLVNSKCYKKLVLGNACNVKEECSIPFSSCIQNVCACDDNMEPSGDDTRCIVMKAIEAGNMNCTDDHFCARFGELYKCYDGYCICKPGYHFSGINCVEEKRLGDPCDRDSDCTVDYERMEKAGLRECRNKECTCINGYKSDTAHNLCKSGASSNTYNYMFLVLAILFFVFPAK